LASWADAQAVRDCYAKKRPITSFLGAFVGGAPDPINFIPAIGPATRALAAARLGRIGGMIATASADAALNTAIAGVATARLSALYDDDTSWQAMAVEIGLDAAVGAAFGAAAGALGRRRINAARLAEARKKLATLQNTQKAAVALNEAVGDLALR